MSTNSYCIRNDDKKRLLKNVSTKIYKFNDISGLGPSVTGRIEVIPMVVMDVPLGTHSECHQSGHDDDQDDEGNVQIAFVFILAAGTQNRHQLVAGFADRVSAGTDQLTAQSRNRRFWRACSVALFALITLELFLRGRFPS